MTEIAPKKSPDVKACNIVAARLGDSAQNIVQEMRGGGGIKRKRSAPVSPAAPKQQRKTNTDSKRARAPRKKQAQVTKRDIFA
jgi:hypothetical protein